MVRGVGTELTQRKLGCRAQEECLQGARSQGRRPQGRHGGKGNSWPAGLPVWSTSQDISCQPHLLSPPCLAPLRAQLRQSRHPQQDHCSSLLSNLSAGLCCPPHPLPGLLEASQWFLMCAVRLLIIAFSEGFSQLEPHTQPLLMLHESLFSNFPPLEGAPIHLSIPRANSPSAEKAFHTPLDWR